MRQDDGARPPAGRGLVTMTVAVAQGCHANAGRGCGRGGHLIPFYLHCKGHKRDGAHYK